MLKRYEELQQVKLPIQGNLESYVILKIRSERNNLDKNIIVYFDSPKRIIKIYDETNDYLIE